MRVVFLIEAFLGSSSLKRVARKFPKSNKRGGWNMNVPAGSSSKINERPDKFVPDSRVNDTALPESAVFSSRNYVLLSQNKSALYIPDLDWKNVRLHLHTPTHTILKIHVWYFARFKL